MKPFHTNLKGFRKIIYLKNRLNVLKHGVEDNKTGMICNLNNTSPHTSYST